MILTVLKLHSPKGSCNFENCQNHSYLLITNCTRGRAISYTNCYELRVSDNFHTDLTKLVDIHEQEELKDRGK